MDPAGYIYMFIHVYVMKIIKRGYKFESEGGTWKELEGRDLGEAEGRKRKRESDVIIFELKCIMKH